MKNYAVHTTNKILSLLIMGIMSILLPHICCADDVYTSVEFLVPYNAVNGAAEPFTPLVHVNGMTFLVWLDANFRPWVTQKINGIITAVPLDPNPDYTAFHDGHHRFSMGIDKYGYLHVAGDMHYYPSVPADYLPARYQNQTILYWVSNKPYDASGGFTFAGGAGASTAIPGQYFNTVHFFNDNNYELYFTGMVRAYQSWSLRLTGEQGVGLYKYNADTKTWSIIGDYGDVFYPPSPSVDKWKVFWWEYAGKADHPGGAGWFQNLWPSFAFDNNNNLHFSLSAIVDNTYQAPTRLLYAVSKDGGQTWYKANGTKIPGLPLRGIDSAANCADVVFDTKSTFTFGPQACVVPDVEGNPCVTTNTQWYEDPVWRRWNGTAWTNDISNSHQCFGARAYLAPDGSSYFFYNDRVRQSRALTAYSSQYNLNNLLGLSQYMCVSYTALKNRNTIYCLGTLNKDASTLSVVTAYFNNRPLPYTWNHVDIGQMPLGGDSDYYFGLYNVRSSGDGIQDNADSLQFAYKSLHGDGSIVARLTYQDTIRPNAIDGVMIRETLNPNSACAMIGQSYGWGKFFKYRAITNRNAASVNAWNSGNWFKLTRIGQVFTAYSSQDGVQWEQIGSPQTIAMAENVYVGLVGWSSEPLTEIHTAVHDQVKISSSVL